MQPMIHSATCSCLLHRRRFLQLAGAAGLATFPFVASAQMAPSDPAVPALPVAPTVPVVPVIEERALLLICNEPLVWQQANNYLKTRNLAGKNTPVEVSGAAIGLVSDEFKSSSKASWDAVMSAATPQITRVIALNHRGCSAMKVAYGVGKLKDKLIETETHRYALKEFRKLMLARNPALPVEIGLIGVDGKVEMFS
jgi:hypothetical protein